MNEHSINSENNSNFWNTLKNDWQQTKKLKTLKQDWKNLRSFYLTSVQKKKLVNINKYIRWAFIIMWLVKGMFFNLTPMRRILLVLSLFLIISVTISINLKDTSGYTDPLPGYVVLGFILILELKDKLLARNELREGKFVQTALRPHKSPEIEGWDVWFFTQPANEVSGDLIDLMPLSGNKFYFALGDVAGKGLGAALLMAKLQATIRAIAADCKNLEDLGKRLNTIFLRDNIPTKFASLVYFECLPNSGTIQLLNAGHFPPLVLKGSTIIETEKGAPAIGIMKNTRYAEQNINLENDDIFFVYSDGLVEAFNEHDEFYGETKLYEILSQSRHLSCQEIGEKIMHSVEKFIGDTPLYDDTSIIILKKK